MYRLALLISVVVHGVGRGTLASFYRGFGECLNVMCILVCIVECHDLESMRFKANERQKSLFQNVCVCVFLPHHTNF